jgi:deoxyinosine 3'endonuclease (endonuclease V)
MMVTMLVTTILNMSWYTNRKQEELQKRLIVEDTEEWMKRLQAVEHIVGLDDVRDFEEDVAGLRYVGGLDISFPGEGDNVNACVALTVIHVPSLQVCKKIIC